MKKDKKSVANRKGAERRPPLLRTTAEMRRVFAMLGDELATYPDVTTKPMFGFTGYYRDGVIFAALPKTRALNSPNALIFKIPTAPARIFERACKDPHITVSTKGQAGWQTFEIASENDISLAQQWLAEAWRWAGRK